MAMVVVKFPPITCETNKYGGFGENLGKKKREDEEGKTRNLTLYK